MFAGAVGTLFLISQHVIARKEDLAFVLKFTLSVFVRVWVCARVCVKSPTIFTLQR